MASIAEKIAQIRNAILGKDVRENIASGIEAINTEVESTTTRQTNLENTFNQEIENAVSENPASAETVQARTDGVNNVTYGTLKERMDADSSTLAEKASQEDLNATNSNLTDGLALKRDKATLITTADIDKSSDANKIHLLDLAEEVQSAMAGTAPVISTVADGSLTETKYADNSITSAKKSDNSQFGLLVYTVTPPNFDFNLKTITFYANTALIFKKARYLIANGSNVTIDISSADPTIMYGLFYNKSDNTFTIIGTGQISSVSENLILIATFHIYSKSVNIPSRITVNGLTQLGNGSATSSILTDINSMGLLISDNSYPNFDFENNQITFYSNTILLYKKSRYVIATGSSRQIDISTGTVEQFGIFYNKTTDTFNVYTTSQINSGLVTENDILIASFQKSKKLVFMAGGYFINGVLYGVNIPTPSLTTRFFGKKGNFLGDSITWGYSPVDDGSQLDNPFPTLVGETLGLLTVNNYGSSGSTIGDLDGAGANNPMCERYISMDATADFTFILGGTNDYAKNIPLGTISDNVNTTFYGALNILINGLLDMYPTQTIVLATPLHRQGDTVVNSLGLTLLDYVNAIISIGKKYGIAVLDLYATSGFYPDNATNYNAICPDGRHPNDAGHIKLKDRICGFLVTV